jgi:hypothetical protein
MGVGLLSLIAAATLRLCSAALIHHGGVLALMAIGL